MIRVRGIHKRGGIYKRGGVYKRGDQERRIQERGTSKCFKVSKHNVVKTGNSPADCD